MTLSLRKSTICRPETSYSSKPSLRTLKAPNESTHLTDLSILLRTISRPSSRNTRPKRASFRHRNPRWILSSTISVHYVYLEKIRIFCSRIPLLKAPRTSLMTKSFPKNLRSTLAPNRSPLPDSPPLAPSRLSPSVNCNRKAFLPTSPPLWSHHLP